MAALCCCHAKGGAKFCQPLSILQALWRLEACKQGQTKVGMHCGLGVCYAGQVLLLSVWWCCYGSRCPNEFIGCLCVGEFPVPIVGVVRVIHDGQLLGGGACGLPLFFFLGRVPGAGASLEFSLVPWWLVGCGALPLLLAG